jgi:hypothetical protein
VTSNILVLFLVMVPIPLFGIVWAAFKWMHRNKRQTLVKEKLLRLPGHSVRLKMDELTEKLQSAGMAAIFIPFIAILASQKLQPNPTVLAILAGLFLCWTLGMAIWIIRILQAATRVHWGLKGELVVAEYVSQLREDGFWIYHDFPTDYGNIDHIAVGPGGVFAIETKARRKKLKLEDKETHVVEFKQGALFFPEGRDVKMITQAQRQAAELSKYLSQARTEPLKVAAILVLPGWWIERKEKPPIPVVTHKELPGVILKSGSVLGAEELKRIRMDIEQRCRDVVV